MSDPRWLAAGAAAPAAFLRQGPATDGAPRFLRWAPTPQPALPAVPAALPGGATEAPGADAQADTAGTLPEPAAPVAQAPQVAQAAAEAAEAAAYARGLADGARQALDARQAALDEARGALQAAAADLQSLVGDPERLYEPLRRLALELAGHLLRAELQQAPASAAALVRQAVAALQPAPGTVVVRLHPELAAALVQAGQLPEAVRCEPDPGLRRGDVRVQAGDAAVEDLLEHRLEALAQRLLAQPARAVAQSPLLRDPAGARRTRADDVADALPREPGRGPEAAA